MIRRTVAWLLLGVSVLGPPVLLLAWGFRDWGGLHLSAPTDINLMLAVLTVVGWAAWAGWVMSIIRAAAAWRQAPGARAPAGLRGLTFVAGALIAAALSTAIAVPLVASVPVSADTIPEGRKSVETRAPVPGESTTNALTAEPGEQGSAPVARTLGASSQTAPTVVHQVAEGEDLWSLAQYYYGDGGAWRAIVAANPDLSTDPTQDLRPGTELTIRRPVRQVEVAEGDTLSSLAEASLGDPNRWPELFELNHDRITDADHIEVGWALVVPALDQGNVARTSSDVTDGWTVTRGASTAQDPGVPSASTAAPESTAMPQRTGSTEGSQSSDSIAPPRSTVSPGGSATQGDSVVAPAPTADVVAPSGTSGEPSADVSPAAGPAETTGLADVETAAVDRRLVAETVGGLTALTAAAVLGGLALARRRQASRRPVGRRFIQPGDEPQRAAAALTLVSATPEAGRELLVARAMRHLSAHWYAQGEAAPMLERAVVSDHALEFVFTTASEAPEEFARIGNRISIAWSRLEALPEVSAPVAYPALVTLGADDQGNLAMVDLVASGVVGLRAGSDRVTSEALSAMLVELACAPWAEELHLLVVTGDPQFAQIAGTQRVETTADIDVGLAAMERIVTRRRMALGGEVWDRLRLDPDRADAWTPHLVLFEEALPAEVVARVEALVESVACGVAAVLPVGPEAGDAVWEVTSDETSPRIRSAWGQDLTPQVLPAATRDSIGQLYTLADAEASESAPWWAEEPEEPVNIIELHPAPARTQAPHVLLLGPIDLVDAPGTPPSRATRQCIEYCAWLLEHPGGTPTEMVAQLFVTDATRRSNLSRLRAWLGADDEGRPYLPDAYSGRIHLHEALRSDWQDLQALTAGGINRMSLERMKVAMEMVRGAPLADAAPGQWGWAEELRSDMSALVRDLGVVMSRTARERGDLDLARWAVNRALVAAPEDELLLGERIRTERASGRTDEVERLVNRVTRQARTLGVDLLPETIDLIQDVMEGRRRMRRV